MSPKPALEERPLGPERVTLSLALGPGDCSTHSITKVITWAVCGQTRRLCFLSSYQALHTQTGADGAVALLCPRPMSARPGAWRRSAFLGPPGNQCWGDRSHAPSQRVWPPRRACRHWVGTSGSGTAGHCLGSQESHPARFPPRGRGLSKRGRLPSVWGLPCVGLESGTAPGPPIPTPIPTPDSAGL